MAPIEDLQSRDLEWISDFVMQQMVIMLRPMMEHLQQTDTAVDYAQHAVQRLNMDISEVRTDLERTNKYLAILRQGLGVQNEGRCVLQRAVENATRATKRLDEQMEGVLDAMRGTEGAISGLSTDARGAGAKHDDLARQVTENATRIEDLQAKVERTSGDANALRDTVLSSEARLEVWQRELRELRRQQIGELRVASKFPEDKTSGCTSVPPSSQGCRALGAAESSWPQKKSFTPIESYLSAAAGSGPPGAGSSQQSKRMSRVSIGASTKPSLLTQDHLEFGAAPPQPRGSSRAGIWGGVGESSCSASREAGGDDGWPFGGAHALNSDHFNDRFGGGADEPASASSRLPLLAVARQGAVARPPENGYSGSRWRFSATMNDRSSSRGGT